MGITKNRLSESKIEQMVVKAFSGKKALHTEELTEGLCNAAYFITLEDRSKTILKIAPRDKHALLSNEVNMMQAEVGAMRLVAEKTDIPVPQVYFYDDSRTICDSAYFFMEVMEGQSYFSCKQNLEQEQIHKLDFELGVIEKKISSIHGEKFGLLADQEHWTEQLFDTVSLMIARVLQDAEAKSVNIGYSLQDILSVLNTDRKCFDEVTKPVLVHWDMWEGNVFIHQGHVSGIIDWERAMWGEVFMDDRFRRHTRSIDFLRGFGKEQLTDTEMQRIYWYDVLLYLTMMTEGAYREYQDDSQYQWVKPLFESSYAELRKRHS